MTLKINEFNQKMMEMK